MNVMHFAHIKITLTIGETYNEAKPCLYDDPSNACEDIIDSVSLNLYSSMGYQEINDAVNSVISQKV